MNREDQFDLIILDAIEKHFPELLEDLTEYGHLWIKAQIFQESRFDPNARSNAGAMGLMQLMPGTARDMGVDDPFDPVQNIFGGVAYLADQYRHLKEIPAGRGRLRFSFASYNGGRGYVNSALALARISEGMPKGLREWRRKGSTPGEWQGWGYAMEFLKSSLCSVNGLSPDWRQMIEYVHYIESRFSQYLDGARVPRQHPAWS